MFYEHIIYVFLAIAQRLQEQKNHVNKLKTTHTDCLRVAMVFLRERGSTPSQRFRPPGPVFAIHHPQWAVRGWQSLDWYETPKIQSQGISMPSWVGYVGSQEGNHLGTQWNIPNFHELRILSFPAGDGCNSIFQVLQDAGKLPTLSP